MKDAWARDMLVQKQLEHEKLQHDFMELRTNFNLLLDHLGVRLGQDYTRLIPRTIVVPKCKECGK